MIRRSNRALGVITVLGIAAGLLFTHAAARKGQAQPEILERAAMVRELGLTDLCLFTEARYTRHPSQADLHSAFQDHPIALEHFPSGSMLPPRRPLKE